MHTSAENEGVVKRGDGEGGKRYVPARPGRSGCIERGLSPVAR